MKPVRFKDIPIGSKCRTKWNEQLLKIKEVRIQTNCGLYYRSAVNIKTGELTDIYPAQWVWIE